MAKHSMVSILPRFNAARTVGEYLTRFYKPAAQQWRRYVQLNFAGARAVANWKARVRTAWQSVSIRRIDPVRQRIPFGESLRFEVAVILDGLTPEDVVVELLLGRPGDGSLPHARSYQLSREGPIANSSEHLYMIEFKPELCGKIEYHIRIYPFHELLTHRFEMGMMKWL
jgi:starch phosphorylase